MKTLSPSGNSKGITALVLVAGIFCSACVDIATSTVAGSALGAVGGAIIGHQRDRLIEGAVIGALIGGAAGYVVGKTQTKQVASARSTNTTNNYRSVAGLQVKQTNTGVSPVAAHPGDDIDINSTIALMAPREDAELKVRQRIAIYKGDELVGSIIEDKFALTPGTHRITRRITLERDMPAGRYTFVSHVKVTSGDDASETTSESAFTVS